MHNVSSSFLILLLLQKEVFNLLMKLINIVMAFFEQIMCQKSNTKQKVNEHSTKGNYHQVTSIINFIQKKKNQRPKTFEVIYLF